MMDNLTIGIYIVGFVLGWIVVGEIVAPVYVRIAHRFPNWWLSHKINDEFEKHHYKWVVGEGPMLLALTAVWLPLKIFSLVICSVLNWHELYHRWGGMEKRES